MTKYIVAVKKSNSANFNQPGTREELACEIISFLSCNDFHIKTLAACEIESSLSTWYLMQKTAVAYLEIDDVNEKQWRNEFVNLFNQDLKIQNAIQVAHSEIVNVALEFDRMCKNSNNFKDIEIVDDMNLSKAFDQIENCSHWQISEVVLNMFKVEYFNNQ
jgi:hypothetical protein